jgi:pSer/pThr/pTyr-binding forkhead associated (FHA) protein
MIVSLIVTKGADHGRTFRIDEGESKVLGRSSSADVILQDPAISRQHCTIRVEGDAAFIADLHSKNGTAVNGRRLQGDTAIRNADVIELGRSSIKVKVEDGEEEPILLEEVEPESEAESDVRIEAPPVALDIPEADSLEAEADKGAVQIEATLKSDSSLLGAFEEYLQEPECESGDAEGEARKPVLRIRPREEEPQATHDPDELAGRTVGGVRIEAPIGSDDISLIYRGVQLSMERPVAMKILVPEMTHDHRAVEQFIQAARAGGRLNHPNLVQIYDAGQDGRVYFIAMELVDGDSARELLRQRGRKRGLDMALAVDVIRQVAEALAYAHDHGTVHRNINPDTILVTRHGIAKLAELGTVQSIEQSGLERPGHPGELMDHLQFSSPEVQRDPKVASPLSDIYSLGAVCFMMLSGHPPFRGANEVEIMSKAQSGAHVPLQKLRRAVPDELAQVVAKAMAAHADRRYQSAAEFERDLRRMGELLR